MNQPGRTTVQSTPLALTPVSPSTNCEATTSWFSK
jgi:hypothetical protein